MWDIPFIPEPLAKPTPWHTSCPAVLQAFWAKTSNHHKPWPRMRISIHVLGRRNSGVSQEKKVIHYWAANMLPKQKKFSIKDRKKTKEKDKFPVKDRKKTKEKENLWYKWMKDQLYRLVYLNLFVEKNIYFNKINNILFLMCLFELFLF